MGRRIRITNEIRSALTRAIDAAGSQSELSRLSGVPQKNLSNYISSANSLMNEATWVQLAPFLQDFLPQEKTAPQKNLMTVCRLEGVTTRAEIVSELVRRVAECDELDEHTRLVVSACSPGRDSRRHAERNVFSSAPRSNPPPLSARERRKNCGPGIRSEQEYRRSSCRSTSIFPAEVYLTFRQETVHYLKINQEQLYA